MDLKELDREVGSGARNLARLAVREGIPSRPLFGKLPLSRTIPQDVHSVMDYATAAMAGVAGLTAHDGAAKACGAALLGIGTATSLVTDYRLSAAKVLPIEGHEVADYAWSLAAIACPFLFGYHRRAPVAAALHVGLGVSMLVASLFTDYRAVRGVTFPSRQARRRI